MGSLDVYSFASFGYEGCVVKIEADLKNGLPITDIVGLPGNAVREARDRIRVAIKNSGFEYPLSRILINLCPAGEKKDGSGFDLPIALSVLCANEKLTAEHSVSCLVIGELELSGKVRKVSGVLAAVVAGLKIGIRNFIVPAENKAEALIPKGGTVFGTENLSEAFAAVKKLANCEQNTGDNLPPCIASNVNATENVNADNFECSVQWSEPVTSDYCEVRGQAALLYALELAAAGGHNLLAYGPPGCGKTLALKKFASLLPDLDFKTSEEVTRIYSIAGLLNSNNSEILIKRPPFRIPHQSASLEGVIGGAGKCCPGEISLAHGGVLFLDEAGQFKASVLQSLRTPLETGLVTLSRAEKRSTFPARFQLLLAMNPCACGSLGSEDKFCTCAPQTIDRYWKKLTAPLLDRIDIRIFVLPPKPIQRLSEQNTSTEQMRQRIKSACEISFERNRFYQRDKSDILFYLKNALIAPEAIDKICTLTIDAHRAFETISQKDSLSGRGSHSVLKIARTIADINGIEKINTHCLEQAILYRKLNPLLPDFL